ncbi:hypothetical protein M438DRAFT_401332 [Aureobasidium pullulans EXF-150]|uniref:Uncharacterized protein n=1 Tax=Aureobasidium pullulans EXF-150 TaxID=1043002 RepID=A0A074XZV5_AURPU|nr:uncharacterized protein M438DRAFT_401332 [Aureobasidium pullulans EXF-150]KEQ89164.1 hypothetical protein M438DRAFT_401332 [Aureobasidium pullulans EXF-150]
MASPFASIASQRVSAQKPPRQTPELDFDRCAALHNTISIYGWLRSGRKVADMDRKTWWMKHGTKTLEVLLRPSLVKYLKKIFDLHGGDGSHFFYYISRLAKTREMFYLGDLLDDNEKKLKGEKHRFITLYMTNKELVSQRSGIVYDQETGKAIFMPTFLHIFDLYDGNLPWQRLESILSAYIDMIEAGKAVALHESIGREPRLGPVEGPDGQTSWQEIAPPGPKVDPYTGAKRSRYDTHPWSLVSYTHGDLTTCLRLWEELFTIIEIKSGLRDEEEDPNTTPLCSRSGLSAAGVPRGFAYDLLSHARQPRIWYIAPGIRLPQASEFVNQPFKHVAAKYPKETEGIKMPFLFFRAEGHVTSKQANFRWPFSTVQEVPCGLYLDSYPNKENPFEDACRLVLPFAVGGNKKARTSDGRIMQKSHTEVYAHGINPFTLRHGPKLTAILENWLMNVKSGHWTVDEQGVSGGVEAWKQADTEEHWENMSGSMNHSSWLWFNMPRAKRISVQYHRTPVFMFQQTMSFLDANQSRQVTQAYRTLGITPITSSYHTGTRTFTKHRRSIAIQDEKIALLREPLVQDPRMDPSQPFPLLDLPAEIRVRIYQYALVRQRRLHLEIARTPNLACVSRQLRREVLPVFLRVNCFQASYTRGSDKTYGLTFSDTTLSWLRSLPLTTKLFRDIRVTFQGDLGQGGHISTIFQIVAGGREVFVNHYNRWCPFCIDGYFGAYYHLPHPNYDHPCLKSNPLKLKNMHDDFVRAVQHCYFTDGTEEHWGKGALSLAEVVDLGKAADKIKEDPEVFLRFAFCVEKVVEHAEKISEWATVYSRYLERQRERELEESAEGENAGEEGLEGVI